MSFTVDKTILQGAKHPSLSIFLEDKRSREELNINAHRLPDAALSELATLADRAGDIKTQRAAEACLACRSGNFKRSVPNFKAFQDILLSYLGHNLIDGWIYIKTEDGQHYPFLVRQISFTDEYEYQFRKTSAVSIIACAYIPHTGVNNSLRHSSTDPYEIIERTFYFTPAEVSRRTIYEILSSKNIFKETRSLKAGYVKSVEYFQKNIMNGFGRQYISSGAQYPFVKNLDKPLMMTSEKVVHEDRLMTSLKVGEKKIFGDSILFNQSKKAAGTSELPFHAVVKVFSLGRGISYFSNAEALTLYQYDKQAMESLILPSEHRLVLNALTSPKIKQYSGLSGNKFILLKGGNGVGKTMTAEIYAEVMERPLYSVLADSLGTNAEQFSSSLQAVFSKAKELGLLLLLDECDSFARKRGFNAEHNAIVAEFLKIAEKYPDTCFLATNLADDIDTGVISRCAVILHYLPPSGNDAILVWRSVAKKLNIQATDALLMTLAERLPHIAPRDMVMVMDLAWSLAQGEGKALDADMVMFCAKCRGILPV